MKYVVTAILFIGFVCVVVLADMYDATKEVAWDEKQEVYTEVVRNRAAYLGVTAAGEYISPKWPRAHMPRAPKGWTRRGWTLEDRQTLAGFIGPVEERKSQLAVMGPVMPMKKEYDTFALDLRRPTTWVYERAATGTEQDHEQEQPRGYVQLAAYQVEDNDNSIMGGYRGAIVDLLSAGGDPFAIRQPYSIEQGVTWYIVAPDEDLKGSAQPDWHLEAEMGGMIFYLRGFLDEDALQHFLARIDYSDINALQDTPLANVGRDAVVLSEAEKLRQMEEDVAGQIRANMALADTGGGQDPFGMGGGVSPDAMLSSIPGANQAITLNLEHKFNKIGMHDREASGDLTVWTTEELNGRIGLMDKGDRNTFRMYASNFASIHGLSTKQASIDYDGNTDEAAAEAESFAAGTLPESHPAYLLRAHEAKIGYPAGSCLMLVSRNIVCGTIAERLRIAKILAQRGAGGGMFPQRDASMNRASGTRFASLGNSGAGLRSVVAASTTGASAAPTVPEAGTDVPQAPGGAGTPDVAGMSHDAQQDHIVKVAFTLMRKGLTPADLKIGYDGQTADAAQEAALYAEGALPEDAPGYAVRAAEAKGGHAPGACLQLVQGTVMCGQEAADLRLALEIKRQRTAGAQAAMGQAQGALQTEMLATTPPPAPKSQGEVRVNRLPTAAGGASTARSGSRTSGGCGGGTSFCRVGN